MGLHKRSFYVEEERAKEKKAELLGKPWIYDIESVTPLPDGILGDSVTCRCVFIKEGTVNFIGSVMVHLEAVYW